MIEPHGKLRVGSTCTVLHLSSPRYIDSICMSAVSEQYQQQAIRMMVKD